MKEFITLFNSNLTEQIGWTLIHNIWQSFLIATLAITLLRFVSRKQSNLRYNIAGSALVMILFCAVGTFIYEASLSNPEAILANQIVLNQGAGNIVAPVETTVANGLQHFVFNYKGFIVLAWIMGTIVFSIRLLGGWLYTNTLRANASLVYSEWNNKLHSLADSMGVTKLVQLAESHTLDSPVVIGFIKPIIIVPIGMFSGLTADEVETILLHELMHIKRHDYIVNILQSIIESVLFFNPFVWILSAIIRREREHCCDDGVIRYHGNAMAYAYALTRLEEIRVSGPSLALSAASNKYELLNRIKRIMEKSVQKYSSTERIIPIALLIVGIVLASFLTIGATQEPEKLEAVEPEESSMISVAVDSPRKKTQEATYFRKSETIINNDGEPEEIITEEYTGDNELFPMLEFNTIAPGDSSFTMSFPSMPELSMGEGFRMPPFPDMEIGVMPNMNMMWPGMHPLDTTKFRGDWVEFSKEFQKQFQQRFKSFYDEHQKELQSMMEEMQTKFQSTNGDRHQKMAEEMQYKQEHLQRRLEELQHVREIESREKLHDNQDRMKAEMERLNDEMRRLGSEMRVMGEKMSAFENEMTEQLIKDGYLKKGEEIKTINWNEKGEFNINGITIKKRDTDKYQKIREKYFKDGGNFRYEK